MRIRAEGDKDLNARTKAFAIRIIQLYAALPKDRIAQTMGVQVLRSGTSVGAHIAEANFGRSRAEFISKAEGALQELQETRYWLELLADTAVIKASRLAPLMQEARELTAILATIVHRSRPAAQISL